MSIKDFTEKIKSIGTYFKEGIEIKNDIFLILLIIFTGLSSYGLGRLSALEKRTNQTIDAKIEAEDTDLIDKISTTSIKMPEIKGTNVNSSDKTFEVYASKNGAKYYYSWCSGLTRIKTENKIQFATAKIAEDSGLTLASGCK